MQVKAESRKPSSGVGYLNVCQHQCVSQSDGRVVRGIQLACLSICEASWMLSCEFRFSWVSKYPNAIADTDIGSNLRLGTVLPLSSESTDEVRHGLVRRRYVLSMNLCHSRILESRVMGVAIWFEESRMRRSKSK